jgi:hypothetical protein
MSEENRICECGHSLKSHSPKTGALRLPCWNRYNSAQDECECTDFREQNLTLHTVISVYQVNQYAIFQQEAREFTARDVAVAINENQEWLRVPDDLEELMQIKHYYFDNLPNLEQKDVAGIIGNSWYRGEKLQVDWRLRELPKTEFFEVIPDNLHDLSKPCFCGHYREVHEGFFGECKECPPQKCKKFWQVNK